MPSIPTENLEFSSLPFDEYDSYLSIRSPEVIGKPIISGQYCLLTPVLPLPSKIFINVENDSLGLRFKIFTNSSEKEKKIV